MIDSFIKIFDRDLNRLFEEINSFRDEDNLWKTAGTISNPAGNLCLHLVGNLNTYIGKNLGGFDYIRNREKEFSCREGTKDELKNLVQETKKTVTTTLEKMDTSAMKEIYPENVLGFEMTTSFFLIHLSTHLSYHLGQINYARRIIDLVKY